MKVEENYNMKFTELNLSKETLSAINDLGFEEATPIQEKAIPVILEGHDVIGQAQTGTGKTAAFVLPILEMIKAGKNKPLSHVIIAPTRELVNQIEQEFKKLGRYHNAKITTIIGGVSYDRQFQELRKNPMVIVATPGRLIDHLKNGKIKFDNLETFICDEADEMFKKGFKEEMDEITSFLPENKQSLLFSATIDENVQRLAKIVLDHPKNISVSSGLMSVDTVMQYAIELKESEKFKTLVQLLDINQPRRAIIFGRTKRRVDELMNALTKAGFKVRGIHGDLSQRERNSVINGYKSHSFNILIATDVAARGLDIKDVTHVYNFDLPQEVEFYVHRIGRTGRAGNEGISISFVRKNERLHIDKIKKESQSKITWIDKPTPNEHIESQNEEVIARFAKVIENGKIYSNKQIAKELLNEYDPYDVVLAAVEMLKTSRKGMEAELTAEPPVRIKHGQGGNKKRYGNKKNYHKRGEKRYGDKKRNDRKRGDKKRNDRDRDRKNSDRKNNDRKPKKHSK
jgi:ATP-dependent RNA helicase DeaD